MINPIQQKLLSMLSWFHDFCVENNIVYYAAGGTVLGAARHNGFIPWDDDIDVVVPREDYNRLIKLLQNRKIEHFFLESPYDGNPDFLYSYAKLYDTSTTLVEKTKYYCKRGIYIDVFPLDDLDDDFEKAITKLRRVDSKNMLLMVRTCAIRKERSWYKNLSIIFAGLIPKWVIDNKELSIKLDKMAQVIGKKNSIYVANLMGTYREKEIVKREWFGTPTLHQFENIQIYVPEKYEEYLESIYGKWNVLPPEDKRKTNHDFVELELELPYM